MTSCLPDRLDPLNYGDKLVHGAFSRDVTFHRYSASTGPQGDKERKRIGPLSMMLRAKIAGTAISMRLQDSPITRLVIVICGPTSLQQDILMNLQMPIPDRPDFLPEFLAADSLRRLVGKGVHSMLVTPNMLGAGWVVSPSFTTVQPIEAEDRSRLTPVETRRAACNIAPLIAKHVRTTLLKNLLSRRWPETGLDQLTSRLGPDLKALRSACEKGSLRFFFSSPDYPPATGLNFDPENDNWEDFVQEGRREVIGRHRDRWRLLPPAILPASERGFNQTQGDAESVRRRAGVEGWFDRTSVPEHRKILTFVLREEWLREPTETRKRHFLQLAESQKVDQQLVISESARWRLVLTSVFRMACHNLADLMVNKHDTNENYDSGAAMSSMQHRSEQNRVLDDLSVGVSNLSITAKNPMSLEKRMDYFKSIFFDSTRSEFLDGPPGRMEDIMGLRDNFLRSVERPDTPFQYLAEVLDIAPTFEGMLSQKFDSKLSFLHSKIHEGDMIVANTYHQCVQSSLRTVRKRRRRTRVSERHYATSKRLSSGNLDPVRFLRR